MKIKSFITKWLLPPNFTNLILAKTKSVSWSGNYSSWEDAMKDGSGYADPKISRKVLSSTLAVIRGEAAFERDSVLFNEPAYNWPVSSLLLWIAVSEDSSLKVLDFGGSLGSTYFQHKNIFSGIKHLKWNIVEQEHFVDMGRNNIKELGLYFFGSMEESESVSPSDVLLLSSVLPYLENPHQFLDECLDRKFKYILIDKTAFIENDNGDDRLTLQTVREPIYDASYPAWFFSKAKFMKHFSANYDLKFSFIRDGKAADGSNYEGMMFTLK
ncbi:MAG: methyltransferase, TIGR04325 family [Candidatus Pacebacteria bacterium CG10_big_fil_rev_8_21_14_0_10_44_54]|nr:MAG: methyltransferase, TIGR04325 family [Candidatus Pacebacteria bacterium CG10_big_fil_rev_8_21_14_0_10_44_54]